MEKRDNEIHAGTWAFLRCWHGILLYIGVAVVCFCQNEILGGIGWVFAALWLFLFNVECVFFKAMKDLARKMQKEEKKDKTNEEPTGKDGEAGRVS